MYLTVRFYIIIGRRLFCLSNVKVLFAAISVDKWFCLKILHMLNLCHSTHDFFLISIKIQDSQ